MKTIKIASLLVILTLSYLILYYGRDLLIPIIIALFIWFLIKEIRDLLVKIPLIGKKLPLFVKNIMSTALMFGMLGFIINMISRNIQVLNANRNDYEVKIKELAGHLEQTFNINIASKFSEFIGGLNFNEILGSLLGSITDLFGNTFAIVLYVLFMLLEESYFQIKLSSFFKSAGDLDNANVVIAKIERSISSYISIKTLTSLMTGFLSFIALLLIGVDAPIFWAFLIFLLNYIPTIGSLIATIFPAIFALIEYGEYTPALLVLIVVGLIQVLVGNILEPRIMGNSLNISSLVVLISLAFWAFLWGVTGMFLSVPIMVVVMIILSEFKSTKPIAILLSEKGAITH